MIAHVGRIFSMRRNEVAPATLLFFYLFLKSTYIQRFLWFGA